MKDIRPITVFGATGNVESGLIACLSKAEVPVIAVTKDLNKAVQMPFVELINYSDATMQNTNADPINFSDRSTKTLLEK